MLDAEKLQGTVGKFSVGNALVVGALAFDQRITLLAVSTSHDFWCEPNLHANQAGIRDGCFSVYFFCFLFWGGGCVNPFHC
jgi:hypothetical protein